MSTSTKYRSGCALGAFVNDMENIGSFQITSGKNLAVVLWYIHWLDRFPSDEIELVNANHSAPLITWEPWVTHPLGTLDAIRGGQFDEYIKSFLQAAKDWGRPLLLRFGHEMNGNWYPWDGSHNGGFAGPEKYKAVWSYIYNIKRRLKADNVQLVWCPNHANQPETDWNEMTNYYPGDEMVDWVGIDGYNWGYSNWQSFDQIFAGAYQSLTELTKKPIMLGEFGCAEQGGSKAAWISEALAGIDRRYQQIRLICWFNINKERDWQVDSSPSAAAAWKNSLQSAHFLDKIPACCI